jgi:hypothetical protein
MSTATITPLPDGTAIWCLNGVEHPFPNWRAAADECDAHNVRWSLAPFPPLSVEVIATSPALSTS